MELARFDLIWDHHWSNLVRSDVTVRRLFHISTWTSTPCTLASFSRFLFSFPCWTGASLPLFPCSLVPQSPCKSGFVSKNAKSLAAGDPETRHSHYKPPDARCIVTTDKVNTCGHNLIGGNLFKGHGKAGVNSCTAG